MHPNRSFIVVFGGSALVALMVAFAARTDVPQTVATTASVGEGAKFDETWNAAASTVTFKSASIVSTEPKLVQTIRVEPDSEVIPPVILSEEKITTKPKYRHVRAERDICKRHGMHKVHQGKSWRCRR